MYISIYVQDNRTFLKSFLHSYVTLSDPGAAQLKLMTYFIQLRCIPPYPELSEGLQQENLRVFRLKCTLRYIDLSKHIYDYVIC